MYMAHNIQIKELIRSVAEWRERSEQRGGERGASNDSLPERNGAELRISL